MKHLFNTPSSKFRLFIVLLTFLLFYCAIIIRLFIIQVTNNRFFEALALEQYGAEVTLLPPRASIYDRNHTLPLAFNQEVRSAFITPQHLREKEQLFSFLKMHFPASYKNI